MASAVSVPNNDKTPCFALVVHGSKHHLQSYTPEPGFILPRLFARNGDDTKFALRYRYLSFKKRMVPASDSVTTFAITIGQAPSNRP